MSTPNLLKISLGHEGHGDPLTAPLSTWLTPAASGAAEERLNLRFDVLPIPSPAWPLAPQGALTAQDNARHELNLAALLVCLIAEERGMTAPPAAPEAVVLQPAGALVDLLRLSMESGEHLGADAAERGAIALPWPIPDLPNRPGPLGETWAYDDGFMKDFHPASAMDTTWQVV